MNLEGLSFNNIPKFSTPLRFFISAPIFGLLACVLLLLPDIWLSRWQAELIAFTHVLTLGFFVMIMFGAITQVLPVLTGRGLNQVDKRAPRIHLLLFLGVMIFPLNFVLQDRFVLLLSLVPLLLSCVIMLFSLAYLFRQKTVTNYSIKAIRFALLGLLITVLTGLMQLFTFQYPNLPLSMGKSVTNIHLMWGLIGWVSALIMAISFQVIPMFHVTPDFPKWLKRYWPTGLFVSLFGTSLGTIFHYSYIQYACLTLIAVSLMLYAVMGLMLLAQRKRKVSDTTVNFWRLAFISLIASIMVFISALVGPVEVKDRLEMLALLLFVFGYLMSVVLGMLVKIVPFLAYLNLQQRGLNCLPAMMSLPSMHELQGPSVSKRIFRSYCLIIPCLIFIPWFSLASFGLAMMLALVFGLLIYLELTTWFNYRQYDDKIKALIIEHER